MLVTLTRAIFSSVTALTRYRVSYLGVRKFLAEIAGIYAIEEIVDQTAEYSDWVKANETNIKLSLSLGLVARNTLLSAISKGSFRGISVLFSKLSLVNPVTKLGPLIAKMNINAFRDGVEIMSQGKVLLKIMVRNGKFEYAHAGGAATAALLAGTFGGQVPRNASEWEKTGEQLIVQLADTIYSGLEQEWRKGLNDFSPSTLLSSGSGLLRQFVGNNPAFSEEQATAMLMDTLSKEATLVASTSLDSFIDADGDTVIRIEGSYFCPKKDGDTYVLEPSVPAEGSWKESDNPDIHQIVTMIGEMIRKVDSDGGLTILKIKDSTRFISSPFIMGDMAGAVVMDSSDMTPHFLFSKSSFFDSAADNMEDSVEASLSEIASSLADDFLSFVGVTDEVEEKPLSKSVQFPGGKITLLENDATYRSGMAFMPADSLSESLGK